MSQHSELVSVSNRVIPKERVFYLTKVSYLESKHEILAEFSNSSSKFVNRYRFFPFISFSPTLGAEKLTNLVLSLGFKGFSVEEENNLLKLRALSFSDLKKISTSLSLHISRMPLVLVPERAFLLEKNWAYFDAFEKIDDLLFKLSFFSAPEPVSLGWAGVDLGFFLTKEIPFNEALKVSEADALFLVERSAWASLLKVPLDQVPNGVNERVEFFLETVFFKHGELLLFESQEKIFSQKDFDLFTNDSTSRIDFSLVWAELFSNNFFNIGPETRNCGCCKPITLDSKNLLPSSLIKVRVRENNFFFESTSESFAFDFHSANNFKEERLSKKKEFYLNSFPVGPLFENDEVFLPLMDAKRLIAEGKVELISSKDSPSSPDIPNLSFAGPRSINPNASGELHGLNWFCLNKESFFSKEVRFANGELFELRKRIDCFENNLFENSFPYLYAKAFFSALSTLLSHLPSQLTNPTSKFFSTELARSIVSVQEATLARFKEFSESNGYRVLHAGKNFAQIKGFSSLKLAKEFSAQTKLPQPQIVGFSAKVKKGFD